MKNWFFIVIVSLGCLSFSVPKNLKKKIDKEIKKVYEVEVFELELIEYSEAINKELPAEFSKNNFYKIKDGDNELGYAYISKAPSKTDEFDYLVLFDTQLIVTRTKVLVYREDYGGEIGSKRWLKQFTGKTSKDNFTYGDNIAAISGATISVRSMTNAINDLLKSVKILQEKELL